MPYDWESEQFNEHLQEMIEESPAQQPVMETLEEVDEAMSEAERRFEIAQYYKLLLKDSLFQNRNETADIVENEIRGFIRERLGVLLGVKTAPAATSGFTPDQVAVLASFAELGEEAPEMLRALMGRITKKMDKKANKPVKEPPALKVVKEPPRPTLRKVQQEEPEEPVRTPEPRPRQLESAKPRGRKPNNLKIPIPEEHKDDPTLKIEGTKIFVQAKNTDGKLLWEKVDNVTRPVYKDVTPVAKPVGNIQPLPMPSGEHLKQVMADKAARVIQSVDKDNNAIINQLRGE